MHWLSSLDIALFHFINGRLGNPFFDWLMPVLSGRGVPWLPVAITAVIGILGFGSPRLRLCSLMAVLVVALGDPLVVGTIKEAVGRPRPCLGLTGVIERLGCTTSGSMPSAHAANWFAIAMVLFLFYRRTVWFMLPLAAAVAFSRVYCGVHYPADVLAGAILGAGYAAALVVASQTAWNFLGRRWFPAWHRRLPSLVSAGSPNPDPPQALPANSDLEWLRLGYVVIFLALIGRWLYLASGLIELSEDEAYQWLWSKHLALSYFSKPPGIAFVQWTGTGLFGDTAFGVRFLSPVFAALLSVLVLRFLSREAGGRTAFWTLAITFATPLFVAGSILMTIDPPLVLCWMWAVLAGWRAIQPGGRTRDWLSLGLAIGLGFLFKYTAMLQIVCWLIYFALQPGARRQLRRPGPWLALGIFLVCTLPVLIWNSQHHWATLGHLATDGGLHAKWHPTLDYFWDFTGAETGLLNPFFFVGSLWAAWVAWRNRLEKPLWFFLLCMSQPVFLGHWLYSLHSRVLPNWIAAVVVPMFCLMALVGHERPRLARIFLIGGLILGGIASVFMHDSDLIGKLVGRLPGEKDPSHRVRGSQAAALLIEQAREQFGTNAFIIADRYGTTGLDSFYSPAARTAAKSSTPLVYCVDNEKMLNQFSFWDEYNYRAHRRGQDAIFVRRLDPYPLEPGWFGKWLRREPIAYAPTPPPPPAPDRILAEFETVTNLGVREVYLGERVFQRVQLFGCSHLK